MASTSIFQTSLGMRPVSELLGEQFKVVQISSQATVPEAVRVLSKHHIQCAPVWDEERGGYVGLVDMIDVAALVVTLSDSKALVDSMSHGTATWEQFFQQEGRALADQRIGDVCNFSERNPWCPIWDGTPINSVLDMFGQAGGLHRVPVVNEAGAMRGFVTQSTVLRWLAHTLGEQHPELWSQRVDRIPAGELSGVVSITADEPIVNGFRKIVDRRVSCVAVVHPDSGELVGALSATDLRGSNDDLCAKLQLKAADYLAFQKKKDGSSPSDPVCVRPGDTIAQLLAVINKHKIHRTFVVDTEGRPTRVVSLTDILTFLQFASNE